MERPFTVQERGIGESVDFGCQHEWNVSSSVSARPLPVHPRIKNIAKSIERDRKCCILESMPFSRRTMSARKPLEQIVQPMSSNSSGCTRYRHARRPREVHASTGNNYERPPQAGRIKQIRGPPAHLPGYSADVARRDPDYVSRYDRIRDMVKYIESDVNAVEYQRLLNAIRTFERNKNCWNNATSSRNEICPNETAAQYSDRRKSANRDRYGKTPSEGNLGLALRERVLKHLCLNIANVKDRIELIDRQINGLLDHAERCCDMLDQPGANATTALVTPVHDDIKVLYRNRNYRRIAVNAQVTRRPGVEILYVQQVYEEYLFVQQFIDQ